VAGEKEVTEHEHDLRYNPRHQVHIRTVEGALYRLTCVAPGDCDDKQLEDNFIKAAYVASKELPSFREDDPTTWPKYRPSLYDDRHSSVRDIMRWLNPNPKLQVGQWAVSHQIWEVADRLLYLIPDSSELTAGLRKLLEAKDCLIRASMTER
jgi:hypothetical protein